MKRVTFTDSPATGGVGFDKWRSTGDFNLTSGAAIDPDSEQVKLIFNQGTGATPVYSATLAAGHFVQKGLPIRPRWVYVDKEADVPGALGWQKGTLNLELNKVKDTLVGKNLAIPFSTSAPIRIRQTLRSGDDCATAVVDCTLSLNGKTLG